MEYYRFSYISFAALEPVNFFQAHNSCILVLEYASELLRRETCPAMSEQAYAIAQASEQAYSTDPQEVATEDYDEGLARPVEVIVSPPGKSKDLLSGGADGKLLIRDLRDVYEPISIFRNSGMRLLLMNNKFVLTFFGRFYDFSDMARALRWVSV
jgi:hypothetical protein